MDGYWQNLPGPQMKAAILADWMDELEDWHIDQVRWALRKWRSLHPGKKPNPGHIVSILKGARGSSYVAQRDGREFNRLFEVGRTMMLECDG